MFVTHTLNANTHPQADVMRHRSQRGELRCPVWVVTGGQWWILGAVTSGAALDEAPAPAVLGE